MAAEIDRIANATNFNGIKLLDGSVTNQHGGQGLKIHFGVSNNPAEDYYFVNIGDARATSSTGLRIGGDAKNDIWGQGAAGSGPLAGPGCCTAGYESLDGKAGFTSGETFSYGYNWDWMENKDSALLTGRYLAGRYTVSSSDSLQSLVNKVNAGTQSRVGIEINASALNGAIKSGGTVAVCIGDEAYVFGDMKVAGGEFSAEVSATSASYTYQAKGTYKSSALMVLGDKFLLDKVQISALSKAGFSKSALNALGFKAVEVSATGASAASSSEITASSQALQNLLTALNSAWNNQGLSGLGLNVSAGASAGFYVGSSTVTSTGNGSAVINKKYRTIISGQTLVVNTDIYADSAGNWTTDKLVASALGLAEIVYYIENPNEMKYKASCAFNFDVGVTAGKKYGFSGNTGRAISSAGLAWATNPTFPISFSMSASAVTEDLAKSRLVACAQAYLNSAFDYAENLYFTVDSGSTRTLLTDADVRKNAQVGTNVNAAGEITGILTVNAGIYLDNNGNWTESASIAALFNMGELTYRFSAVAGNELLITAAAGPSLDLSAIVRTTGGGFNGTQTVAANTLTALKDKINANVKFVIKNRQDSVSTNTNGKLDGDGKVFNPPYVATDSINAKVVPLSNGSEKLSATGVFGGKKIDADANTASRGFKDKITTSATVSYIAGYLADSISYELSRRQASSTTTTGDGMIYTKAPAIPPVTITASDISSPVEMVKLRERAATSAYTTSIVINGAVDASKSKNLVASAGTSAIVTSGVNSGKSNFGAWALASAINHNANSQFWAMVQPADSTGRKADMVYVFTKEGGNYNDLLACDVAGSDSASRKGLDSVDFENVQNAEMHEDGTTFTLGGEKWGTMKPMQSKSHLGSEVWNVTLNGRDVGAERDLWIANAKEIDTPALLAGIINGMDRNSFVEIQNAADSPWVGGEIRTQSTAQAALDAITESINTKDKIRADLGALQNRLENTMTNLTVQSENLQASESRISDVDVATEMTEFTRNNVLSQAATSMLAQANSLSQLALSLIR
jgi:flagellin-like hook-associated protein FlgL